MNMTDFENQERFYLFALRQGRGWKLAHGNLRSEEQALAARELIAAEAGVLKTRLNRVRVEVLGEG